MAHYAHTDRRRMLQMAAGGAAALWLPRSAWSQPRIEGNLFGLGVASGSPAHDSLVLWTRLVSPGSLHSLNAGPVTVRWEMAHDDQFRRIAQSGQTQALPEMAHSVHVEVPGLEADRWYFYRFMTANGVSPTGRTRTFPLPDAAAQKLRLAYASCQRWEHGYYSAYRHMREENLDAVLFLGDYIYEYPSAASAVRFFPNGGWAQTLAEYRDRYALHKGDADLQAMHATRPWLMTWDDHEVQNDYAGVHPGEGGPPLPNSVPDFAARKAAAYQAYYEHMPLRASVLSRSLAGLDSHSQLRIYSQHRFGQLARLLLLDARQYKDRQACGQESSSISRHLDPAMCPQWNDPARTMLGATQEQWLDGALSAANAGWTVIGQQTLFGQRDSRPGPGQLLWNDGWDGYAAARTRLTDALVRHGTSNPVLLGGDVHENWVGHVKADYARPDSAAVGVEFCGTSITSRAGSKAKMGERLAENPHFVFADAHHNGYGVAEFTPQRLTTTLRVVDDVRRKDAAVRTLARFAVDAGRPRIEAA